MCAHIDWISFSHQLQQQPRIKKERGKKNEGGGKKRKVFFHRRLLPSNQHLLWNAYGSHLQQTALLDLTGGATAGRGQGVMERGSVWHSLCCSIPGKGDLLQQEAWYQPCLSSNLRTMPLSQGTALGIPPIGPFLAETCSLLMQPFWFLTHHDFI